VTTEDDAKEAFCVFDRDESGYIGIEEISLMFSRFGQDLKWEYIEAVTEAADVDGDGTITFKGRLELTRSKTAQHATCMDQWRMGISPDRAAIRRGWQKWGVAKGTQTSHDFLGSKMQSAPGTDNPRHATDVDTYM